MKYAKEINGIITEVALPNAYSGVLNVAYGYTSMTNLHLLDGFLELEIPTKTDLQKYGEIIRVNDKYIYEVIDLTNEEIEQAHLDKLKSFDDRIENITREKMIVVLEKLFFEHQNNEAISNFLMAKTSNIYFLGDTTTLHEAISDTERFSELDEEINGTTYRAIFLQKFNPKNFIF